MTGANPADEPTAPDSYPLASARPVTPAAPTPPAKPAPFVPPAPGLPLPFAGIAPFGQLPRAGAAPATASPAAATSTQPDAEKPVFIPHPPTRRPPVPMAGAATVLPEPESPGPHRHDEPAAPSKRLRRRVLVTFAALLLITAVGAYANWALHRPAKTGPANAAPLTAAPFVPAPNGGNVATVEPSAAAVDTAVRSISAPLGGRRELTFSVLSDATRSTVRTADLGDQLYIISTTDASAAPSVAGKNGALGLTLTRTGRPGTVSVDVQLNQRVTWKLVVSGAAAEHVIDMRAGGLAGLELTGGASRVVLTLAKPAGSLPITMTGGASALNIHAPSGVPVRIRLGAGARNSSIDGTSQSLSAPNADFNPPGWNGAANRYDVKATLGIDALSLDRRAPS